MVRKIKLMWHRFWLRKHYFMKVSMEQSSTCGLALLEEISSEYREARRMVEHHFKKCKELEGLNG